MIVQSHESDVLSYSECKIAKSFWGFCPGLHWEGLTASPLPPPLDSPAPQQFFSSLRSSKNRHSQKIAGYGTVWCDYQVFQVGL